MKICICKHCGNQITFIKDAGVIPFCCGEVMTVAAANTVDASQEKHLPVVNIEKNQVVVKVGSIPHPMLPEHFIEYIVLETNLGASKRLLAPGKEPLTTFNLVDGEKVLAVYEYCNIHGLWKTEIK